MQHSKRKLLLISAHPDDDSLAGGTMTALASAGWSIYEFVCTSGKNGKPNQSEKGEQVMAQARAEEIGLFMKQIGGYEPYIYDNGKEFLEFSEHIVLELVTQLRAIRPDVIVLLNSQDYHFEHRLAHEIGLRALEIAFRSANLELGEKISHGIILQADGLNVLANPLIHFSTEKSFTRSLEACHNAYGERLGDLKRFMEGLAMMRGARVGKNTAEAFDLLNPPWYKLTSVAAEILAEFTSLGS